MSAPPPLYSKEKPTQLQEDQIQSADVSDYPGVVGGTPAVQKGSYEDPATGKRVVPAFIAQRQEIEQSLGPDCAGGMYHELRMHYTNTSLCFALLILPYLCGWRGRRECVCTRCGKKFPSIVLPQP